MSQFKTLYYIITILIYFLIVLSIILQLGSSFERKLTVAKKYTAIDGVRYACTQYIIEATDGNIYQVNNVWWLADFNKEEDWHNMNVGQTYRVKGWGYRVPLFDMYPNIYEIVK